MKKKKSSQKKTPVGKKPAEKPAEKQPAARPPAARPSAAKKSAAKNSVAKKTVTEKPAAKKPVAKKTVTEKPAAKKVTAKRLTAKKSAAEKKSPDQLGDEYEKFRLLLLDLQRRLKGDVNMMSAEALGGLDADSGDNHAPIHPAEVGTHSFEQEFTLNRISDDGDRLERIEAALDRIEQGIYGACEECGGRIPKARLEVLPDTPYCVKCASSLGG